VGLVLGGGRDRRVRRPVASGASVMSDQFAEQVAERSHSICSDGWCARTCFVGRSTITSSGRTLRASSQRRQMASLAAGAHNANRTSACSRWPMTSARATLRSGWDAEVRYQPPGAVSSGANSGRRTWWL